MDWGPRMLRQDLLHAGDGAVTLRWILDHPKPVFITHPRLLEMAGTLGYSAKSIDTIYDSNGRAVFHVLRLGATR